MSRYKVIVRNSPGWRNHKAATLGVSVLSPNWQGDRFASILAFAAENFDIIRIDVTDALYRHNLMAEGLSPEQALAEANALGALWLTQHQDIIDACAVKPKVVRWEYWYGHPDYSVTLTQTQKAYAANPLLGEAVHNDITGFYHRRCQEPSSVEYEHSKNYLLEELAVACLQARELPSVKIYPGDELYCMNVLRLSLIPEAPRGLEHEQFAKVKFHTRHEKSGLVIEHSVPHNEIQA